MTALAHLSRQLLDNGYSRVADGTFLSRDQRRVVVLADAGSNPAQWPDQVDSAVEGRAVAGLPAWARYVVLLAGSPADHTQKAAATAFSRNVTKCRRLVVFANPDQLPSLPFLPLAGSRSSADRAPEGDLSGIIRRHLGEDLAAAFEQPDATHADIQRDISKRATE